jgi:hypothetical protein
MATWVLTGHEESERGPNTRRRLIDSLATLLKALGWARLLG